MADDRAPDPANWSCPVPLADHDKIVMGHGGGGKPGCSTMNGSSILERSAARASVFL